MNLLTDDIKVLLKKLAIPASVGTLFQTLYNVVDTFFAGKISPEALSALSKSFPIYFIIIGTCIGVTVASTSLIANSIGESDERKTLNYFTHSIYYGILIAIIIAYIGLTYADDILDIEEEKIIRRSAEMLGIKPSIVLQTKQEFKKQ